MGVFDRLTGLLNGHGYVSMFLGGALFSFGFTAAFGVAIMVDVAPHVHPLLAAAVGGAGAMLTDMVLFSCVRFTVFHEEVHHLKNSWLIRRIHEALHHPRIPEHVRKLLLWSVAGFIIASPLPDEFGVTLVSSVSSIRPREFSILCFLLNTTGILVIVLGTRALV